MTFHGSTLDYAAFLKTFMRVTPWHGPQHGPRMPSATRDVAATLWGPYQGRMYYARTSDEVSMAMAIQKAQPAPLYDRADDIAAMLRAYGFEWDKPGHTVLFWQNAVARDADKPKQSIKLGRFLAKILMPDAHGIIEALVDDAKNALDPAFQGANLEFKTGIKANTFKVVYSKPVQKGASAFKASNVYKSLSSSCMQHDADRFGDSNAHPTESYARDFRIIYAVDKDSGDLAARVIITRDGRRSGPIYASNTAAGDALKAHALTMGHDLPSMACDFTGYEAAMVEHAYGYAAAYLDDGSGYINQGCHFLIADHGDCPGTSGHISGDGCESGYCEECEDSCDADDMVYIDSAEMHVCHWCANNHFFRSDHSHEMFRDSKAVEVCTTYGTETWAQSEAMDNAVWSDYDSCYYEPDACVITNCETVLADDTTEATYDDETGVWYMDEDPDWIDLQNERTAHAIAGGIIALLEYWKANPVLPFQLAPNQPKPCSATVRHIRDQQKAQRLARLDAEIAALVEITPAIAGVDAND